jgi:hypothetical protein
MTNSDYQMTGVLTLERVTPVMSALFRELRLDAHYPGKGLAYIALTAHGHFPSWNSILIELFQLAAGLGVLPREKEAILDAKRILSALAGHFHVEQDEALQALIEQDSFAEYADLETLFLLATRFDDGHRLAALESEGCWQCGDSKLFRFGGEAHFFSRTVRLYEESHRIRALGGALYLALAKEDLAEAATLLALETARLLGSIQDSPTREAVRQRLLERLAEFPRPDA